MSRGIGAVVLFASALGLAAPLEATGPLHCIRPVPAHGALAGENGVENSAESQMESQMECQMECRMESPVESPVENSEEELAREIAPSRREELRRLRREVRRHRDGPEAPAALHRMGLIQLEQRRFQSAFRRFQCILDRYPDYPRYREVLELEFSVAERLMRGERGRLLGKFPGPRDRAGAIEIFRRVVDQAPYDDLAPLALVHIAQLALREGDPATAAGALEDILDRHGHAAVAPDALLLLAKVHRSRVRGPDHDPKAIRDAANAYQEFLLLYPDSPRAGEAERGLARAKGLLARGHLRVGNFYYDDRQRPEAARPYYALAIAAAPHSPAAERARERLLDMAAGKPGKGSPLDRLIGRYPHPAPTAPRP
ncbi:MAG: tetratricopeptide repeat protein [Puniceicoccales bacterium]|jgi:outer membrane protein assembly factor BamD (BamD/ComL family)|nr:tetratricopeptide repeat protein [Puniceicoccales bacterium]